ncbi:unnamed protein product [Fusarium graminearum]|nr:hypothetical protein FG05_05569 [Fusarium graminearum]CZS84216.1 unnamed protein product [Fusarium graminearum]
MFGAVSIILSTSKSINAPWTNAKHVAADDKVIRVKDPVFVVAMIFNIKKTRLQNGTDVKLGNEGQAKNENRQGPAPSYSGGGGGGGGGSSSSSTRRGIQLSPIEQCRTVRG